MRFPSTLASIRSLYRSALATGAAVCAFTALAGHVVAAERREPEPARR